MLVTNHQVNFVEEASLRSADRIAQHSMRDSTRLFFENCCEELHDECSSPPDQIHSVMDGADVCCISRQWSRNGTLPRQFSPLQV